MNTYIIGYHARNSDRCHERLVLADSEAQARQEFDQLRFGQHTRDNIIIDYVWEEQ